MRAPSTSAESHLWRALAEAMPRARFMRRIPVGPYTAAFLSRPAMLIVEVDDGSRRARDAVRTRFLNRHGYRIIRFWQEDVLRDLGAVMDALACALPADLLDDSGPVCRLSGPAARAQWSPMPDLPVRGRSPAELDQ